MDYQAIVDGFSAMACVVSVDKNPDGNLRKYRIVTGNKAYIGSIEHPAPGTKMLSNKFIPNSDYTAYLNRDLNFEDYCYRAAIEMYAFLCASGTDGCMVRYVLPAPGVGG